jgi:hypothetical protein
VTQTPLLHRCAEFNALLTSMSESDVEDSAKRISAVMDHMWRCPICKGIPGHIEMTRGHWIIYPGLWDYSLKDWQALIEKSKPRPPLNAEFLLHLVLPDHRIEDAIGDLDERFGKKVERLGIARANAWYYKQVACSTWPYAKAAARRMSSGLVSQTIVFFLRALGQNGPADEIVRARAKAKTR